MSSTTYLSQDSLHTTWQRMKPCHPLHTSLKTAYTPHGRERSHAIHYIPLSRQLTHHMAESEAMSSTTYLSQDSLHTTWQRVKPCHPLHTSLKTAYTPHGRERSHAIHYIPLSRQLTHHMAEREAMPSTTYLSQDSLHTTWQRVKPCHPLHTSLKTAYTPHGRE